VRDRSCTKELCVATKRGLFNEMRPINTKSDLLLQLPHAEHAKARDSSLGGAAEPGEPPEATNSPERHVTPPRAPSACR